MGQVPKSQARSRPKDRLQPSNLAARTLSLVEHTLSKFSGDPCAVRRGLVAAVKCYVRNHALSWLGNEQKWPISADGTSYGFLYDEGKSGLVVYIPIPQLSASLDDHDTPRCEHVRPPSPMPARIRRHRRRLISICR